VNRNQFFEAAVLKRYGKKVEIFTEHKLNDKNEIIQTTNKWVTPKNNVYFLIEELVNGLTKRAILKQNNRDWSFKNHLEAEVTLIDKIGEE